MTIDVILEEGRKRAFASAVDWPGWSRAGRDAEQALAALLAAAPRYAEVLGTAVKGFRAPRAADGLRVVERLPGDTTTDFGSPGAIAEADHRQVGPRDLARLETILRACWAALDRAAGAAEGLTLTKGPRGGGRDLPKILDHVGEAGDLYLRAMGAPPRGPTEVRDAFLDALASRAGGLVADVGPRGGVRWPARYGARREAWHVLDHAWEIQDRARS